MKAVSKSARKVFDAAIARMGVDGHVAINTKPDTYQALVVEKIGSTYFAGTEGTKYALYSFAHYGPCNGDAMRDPDVVMMQCPRTGDLFPISWRNDWVGSDKQDCTYGEDGGIKGIRVRQQADNASFCNMWAKNIKDQQGLGKAAKKVRKDS